MNWSDKDIDELFKEAGDSKTFEYKSVYFKDIEAQLPIRKKNKFFWIFNGAGIAAMLFFALFALQSGDTMKPTNQLAKQTTAGKGGKSQHLESSVWTSSPSTHQVANDESAFHKNVLRNQLQTQTAVPTVELNQELPYKTHGEISNQENLAESTIKVDKLQMRSVNEFIINPENSSISRLGSIVVQSRNHLYVDASGTFGQSLIQNDSKSSAQAFGYRIGGGYQYVAKKIKLSAGLAVSQTFYSNVKVNERSTLYGFGVSTIDHEYDFNSLVQLHVPLEVSYRIKKHDITAGVSANIPVLATFKHKQVNNSETEKNSLGYTLSSSLFKTIVPELNLGYRYNFNKNWSVAAAVNAQLINPIDSDRFQGESTKIPLNLNLSIRKSFSIR